MKLSARMRARGAKLLVTGSSVLALGSCLPDNYLGDLFVRLTTGAADVAVQTLVFTAVDAITPPASGTSGDGTAG